MLDDDDDEIEDDYMLEKKDREEFPTKRELARNWWNWLVWLV